MKTLLLVTLSGLVFMLPVNLLEGALVSKEEAGTGYYTGDYDSHEDILDSIKMDSQKEKNKIRLKETHRRNKEREINKRDALIGLGRIEDIHLNQHHYYRGSVQNKGLTIKKGVTIRMKFFGPEDLLLLEETVSTDPPDIPARSEATFQIDVDNRLYITRYETELGWSY